MDLLPWLFNEKAPTGYWDKNENCRKYFDWLGIRLGFKDMDDWYSIKREDFLNNFGGGMLTLKFRSSPTRAVQEIYPEHNWNVWKFKQIPKGFFANNDNQKMFFEWLGIQLGYKNMEDWYNLKLEQISQNGGVSLMHLHYEKSVLKALRGVFPHHNWLPWKFNRTPKDYVASISNDFNQQYNIIKWLEKNLYVRDPEDWYRISLNQVQALVPFIKDSKTIARLLSSVYQEHAWDCERLAAPLKASQRMVAVFMRELFPKEGKV